MTALFRAGVGAPTVKELAGHLHLSTTQRYAHTRPRRSSKRRSEGFGEDRSWQHCGNGLEGSTKGQKSPLPTRA